MIVDEIEVNSLNNSDIVNSEYYDKFYWDCWVHNNHILNQCIKLESWLICCRHHGFVLFLWCSIRWQLRMFDEPTAASWFFFDVVAASWWWESKCSIKTENLNFNVALCSNKQRVSIIYTIAGKVWYCVMSLLRYFYGWCPGFFYDVA